MCLQMVDSRNSKTAPCDWKMIGGAIQRIVYLWVVHASEIIRRKHLATPGTHQNGPSFFMLAYELEKKDRML